MNTEPTQAGPSVLTNDDVIRLRSEHGWAKETIRAIEAAVLARFGAPPQDAVNRELLDMVRQLIGVCRLGNLEGQVTRDARALLAKHVAIAAATTTEKQA